jgi:hypothetical protein
MSQFVTKKYESPVVEIIEVNVERGFISSGSGNLEDVEFGGEIN